MQLVRNCVKLRNLLIFQRTFTTSLKTEVKSGEIVPEYNVSYLLDPENLPEITANISRRKGVGDIRKAHELARRLKDSRDPATEIQLHEELGRIPNNTHPEVVNYGDEAKVLQMINEKRNFSFKPHPFATICQKNNLLRMEKLGNFSGHKSYYLMGDLAELEQALLQYTVDRLTNHQFEMINVPDIIPAQMIEGCGFTTTGERNQVYKLSEPPLCLSGTAEMALAGFFAGQTLQEDSLPRKVMAVSRCYRAEVSGLQEERGIYRVHQFSKVEMFGVANPNASDELLEEFRNIQVELFSELGLHFKILDMPPPELGAPAYRKYDIEAFMEGRSDYGEISSCSNCTDYQARRLGIRLPSGDFAHTVNGTACAVPRMLIAILEAFQNDNGTVNIPDPLRPYMSFDQISRRKAIPQTNLVKKIENPGSGSRVEAKT
ncbi:serine--tRNA ligase, mitochondrial [Phlebotomus argentipes]|uniref:serine--tRNA ligase, mitochondrial n=1 Tax=Phlebotomus argentipes TaxID=94469 RepID=UPI002893421F|nr:serine--tRNA ligase, mitochondrial [Phlebotomus argentipes]